MEDLPEGREAVGCKWVFLRKKDEDGNIEAYKAWLVAQEFFQKPRMDYSDTTQCAANDEEMGELTTGSAAPTDMLPLAEGMDLGEDDPLHPPSPSPLSILLLST